jgi:hypothetical protein
MLPDCSQSLAVGQWLKSLVGLASGVAGVEGLEPPTPGFGDRCSSQLSYTPKACDSKQL